MDSISCSSEILGKIASLLTFPEWYSMFTVYTVLSVTGDLGMISMCRKLCIPLCNTIPLKRVWAPIDFLSRKRSGVFTTRGQISGCSLLLWNIVVSDRSSVLVTFVCFPSTCSSCRRICLAISCHESVSSLCVLEGTNWVTEMWRSCASIMGGIW